MNNHNGINKKYRIDQRNKENLMQQALRWNNMSTADVAEETAYGLAYLKGRFDKEVGKAHLVFLSRE